MTQSSAYQLESVERALRVLGCFSAQTPELRLTDIANMLEINKVQALRLASTLESQGFLIRDPRTKYYSLGLRLFQLGMVVQQQSELTRISHSYLHDLVAETGETARLMVPDPAGPTCLDLVESPRRFRVFGKLGGNYPWHAGTSTKLLLAYLPDEWRDRVLAEPLAAFTPTTTVDPEILREQLADIRRRGHHISAGDIESGAIAIAAPIFGSGGDVLAAISVSGPTERLTGGEVERVLGLVLAAAGDISRALGHRSTASISVGRSMRSTNWNGGA